MINDTLQKKAWIIGGYSGAGKTTLVNQLESDGWVVASTSRVNRLIADKSRRYYDDYSELIDNDRKDYIHNAENILIPAIGRIGLVAATIFNVVTPNDKYGVVCETIGGEEYYCFIDILMLLGYNEFNIINLRHVDENPKVDRRVLLNEYRGLTPKTIWRENNKQITWYNVNV